MNLQAQLQQAQALAQAGRVQEAWTILGPLRAAIDRQGQALRLYALVSSQAGKTDETIDALKRIVALENAPPEIVGALADTLGSAGRYAEAAEQWTRLVRLRPDIPDAHLNRAVTFTNAGKNVDALSAADEGLSRFPGHPRLLAARASALKNLKRIDEATIAFERAVAADPSRALVRQNQAVTLRAACRYDEACAAFQEAARLGAKGAEFLSNWAAASLEAGSVDDAASLYRRALAEEPMHGQAREALTRLEIEYRGGENAFDHYHSAAEATSDPEPWLDWVGALIANRRYSDAAEAGRRGISRTGGNLQLLVQTLIAEGAAGDAEKAFAELEQLPGSLTEGPATQSSLMQLALRAQQFVKAAELAERYNRHHPLDQIGWTTLSLAWRMLNDPREHWLCDYDRLVMVTEVPSPDGTKDPQAFAALVASALDPLHQTLDAPGNQSLRNGTQTSGELFAKPDPTIQEFRKAVIAAAADAVSQLPDDPTHPFLSRKSKRFDFSGSWSVRLRGGGGHHVPHFHGQGWMSSAYYARLPATGPKERQRHGGWIEFGRPPETFGLDIGPRRVVEPQVGRLVLFPSYLWHGTVPFDATGGDRLTAAFDYQPI